MRSVVRFAAASALMAVAATSGAATLGRDLERALAHRGTHADTSIIVRFADPIDLRPLAVQDRRARDGRLLAALRERGEHNQATLAPWLAAQHATKVRNLWIVNAVAATVAAVAVKDLAARPDIAHIDLDSFVQGGRSQRMPASRTSGPSGRPSTPPPSAAVSQASAAYASAQGSPGGVTATWNVAAVHAPELWALGHSGRGVVVATMDTGVDAAHPALRQGWRGGPHGWFDPHGEELTPYDALGHGTQALGVIVGAPGIGVAPDARWIAVRLYNGDGHASLSDIHRAFQWLLDPDGDPATADAPDVVSASWALSGRGAGTCTLEFSDDIRVLKAAGILVVFAGGNDGPMPGSSNSPGNNPNVMSVGPVDRDLAIGRQSSRGPSACDGDVFPRVVAPGVNVRTTDLSHGGLASYTMVSGSSLAAPHAAGVLALLAGAFPAASVAELEDALTRGARDLGAAGPDAAFGHGLIDALASFRLLNAGTAAGLPGAVRSATAAQH